MTEPLRIDGAMGEGGGQVLRTALALAALTRRAVRIERIRARRARPGLSHQHLAAVRLLAAVCGARLEGDALRSQAVDFRPGTAAPGDYRCDVAAERASAGAVTLVLQSVLPVLALADAPSTLVIRGGTHVDKAPTVGYVAEVLLPALASLGVRAEVRLRRHGWFDGGGGEIDVRIEPAAEPLAPLDATARGPVLAVRAVVTSARLPDHVGSRQAARLAGGLRKAGVAAAIERVEAESDGAGTASEVFVRYARARAGFSCIGRIGLPAEEVATRAARAFAAHHRTGAPVDPHLADQLVPYLALAAGTSTIATSRITDHLRTNLEVARLVVGAAYGIDESARRVRIEGVGLRPAA